MEQQHPTLALEETAIQDLVSHLRGALLRPGDADYTQAARVYNGMINKQPALIAHCVDVADVIAAVNFAREQVGVVSRARRRAQRPRPGHLR